jgi:hypothetical protein
MYQYDATNAFLNANLPRTLYCYTPEGFQQNYGPLLLLQKALYGLKEAPLLWYQTFSEALTDLGLEAIPNTPCLYASKDLIVFFCVDDIVVLVHPNKVPIHSQFEKDLLAEFEFRLMGQLSWFLGIRVIRDRQAGLTWLLQDAHINKINTKFDIMKGNTTYPSTPLPDHLPAPLIGPVHPTVEKEYQQLVGQLAYISIQTRGDTSKAHSWLSGHLTRASSAHVVAARHVWKFLVGSMNYAQ